MAQKNISIYITSDVIQMCDIETSGSGLAVNSVFSVPTPPNSFEDGVVTDIEAMAQAIQQALNDNEIKKPRLTFTVYSRKIAAKEIELPFVKQINKIGEMINSNADDYFPMGNMQDYITRYSILEKVDTAERKYYRINVYAIQKELVLSYRELGKLLKIPVATVDYQVNSLYNLMKKQVKQGTHLMLQMDEETTHVSIMNGQALLFRRAIPYGRGSLIQSAATLLKMDEEGAHAVLRDIRLLQENLTDEEYMELVQELTQAITRVVEFYTSKNPIEIEDAKLYGVGAELAGLGGALEGILGINIETMTSLNGVQIKKDKKSQRSLSDQSLFAYLPNIGAMIHSLDLKLEEEAVKKTGIGYGLLFVLLGLSAATAIGISIFVWYEGTVLTRNKTVLEADIASLKVAEDIYNAYLQADVHRTTINTYVAGTTNNNEVLVDLISDLERVMPENMGIDSLSANNGEINMTGSGDGKPYVALLVMALKELPYVSDVRVQNIRDVYDEFGGITSEYSITFQIIQLDSLIDRLLQTADSVIETTAGGATEGGTL
jgi:type IV pilus assembly protein PilM